MINIFYSYYERGPKKVVDNFIKGVNLNEIQYSINLKRYKNSIFFSLGGNLNEIDGNSILGPNIWFEEQFLYKENYKYFIVPSEWVKKLIIQSVKMKEEIIKVWPVGIDYNFFKDTHTEVKTIDCLIYYKNRHESELKIIVDSLDKRKISHVLVRYGNYDESNFLEILKTSKFAIILANTESQGIAIQEIMSSNLPLFVCDCNRWTNGILSYDYATSIPYWSDNCGISISNLNDFDYQFDNFIENLESFSPRSYIIKNLDMKGQSKKIIELFNN
jgi:hypothetical protein